VASAITALALWALPVSRAGLVAILAVVTVVGTWAAHRAARLLGGKDPRAIVIDEVAGMTLSVLAFAPTPAVLTAGLALFRLFDVIKPFPARQAERLPGGIGIMADDLVAGLYVLGALGVCRVLVGWP